MPRRLHMRDFSCVIFFFVFFFYEFKCTRSRICELYTIVCVCVEPREIVDKSPAYSRLHIFFFPAQNVSLFARVCIWHIGMQCYMRSSINLSRRQLEKHWHSWKSRLLLNEMNAFICVCRSLSVGLHTTKFLLPWQSFQLKMMSSADWTLRYFNQYYYSIAY